LFDVIDLLESDVHRPAFDEKRVPLSVREI
jgi:hypothetical protein